MTTREFSDDLLVRRVPGSPIYAVEADGNTVAHMDRPGWWRIFMGRGQKIELADGTRWRLRSMGKAGAICPVIIDEENLMIALATPVKGGYGVEGADYGFSLYPVDRRSLAGTDRWVLREREHEVAQVTRFPQRVTAYRELHIGAALLALAVIKYGIPGEDRFVMPRFQWTTH